MNVNEAIEKLKREFEADVYMKVADMIEAFHDESTPAKTVVSSIREAAKIKRKVK